MTDTSHHEMTVIKMVTKKTLWEKLFPGREHKHAQKSTKINYANKYQFMRNMTAIANKGGGPSAEMVRTLRDTLVTENLIIIIITTAISIGLLYYCDSKMTKGGQ